MLVSHRYKFIYTKTVKTAGTSVESFFERFCMPDGMWKQVHERDEYESPAGIIGFRGKNAPQNTKWYNHMSAEEIRRILGDNIWNAYFKFCVVRNPYEKCISAFDHFGRDFQAGNSTLYDSELTSLGMTSEQLRFLDYIRHDAPIDQNKYLINGDFCLDDVIRYESLESDIERICQHLHLPFELPYLPTFKKGFRRPEATASALFTELSRQEVEKRFAFEIQFFGYEFPNPAPLSGTHSLRVPLSGAET